MTNPTFRVQQAESRLRRVRNIAYEYPEDRVLRVIEALKARCADYWAARAHAAVEPKLRNYMM